MAIIPLSAPFCPGYRDKSELGDWKEDRGPGAQWHSPARHLGLLPNILVIVAQEAAKNIDS